MADFQFKVVYSKSEGVRLDTMLLLGASREEQIRAASTYCRILK
jgi:hypothetical protein